MNDDQNSKPNKELVIVEWEDSQASSGWEHEKNLNPDYQLPIVYTVGYIVQDDPRYVTIAQSMIFYKEVSNQLSGVMTIPRGCITSIKRLRKGGEVVRPDKDRSAGE